MSVIAYIYNSISPLAYRFTNLIILKNSCPGILV